MLFYPFGPSDLSIGPFDQFLRVHVLPADQDHAHPGDGRRRGVAEVDTFEDEVDIGAELDTLAGGQSEQFVVVQHRVQRFDPSDQKKMIDGEGVEAKSYAMYT